MPAVIRPSFYSESLADCNIATEEPPAVERDFATALGSLLREITDDCVVPLAGSIAGETRPTRQSTYI